MSVEQAQKLVIGENQNQKMLKLLEKLMYRTRGNAFDKLLNFYCLVSGKTTNTEFFSVGASLLYVIIAIFAIPTDMLATMMMLFPALVVLYPLFIFTYLVSQGLDVMAYTLKSLWNKRIPVLVGSVGLGYDDGYPAQGYIQTFGLLGARTINGSFCGQLCSFILHIELFVNSFRGILGFKGLKMLLDGETMEQFYLGSCFFIDVGLTEPFVS